MVTDIFLDWESYQFGTEEIDAVFHGAVWPQVNLDVHSAWIPLLLPLLLLHQQSLHSDMKECLSWSFLSGSFRTLSLPPLPPEAQELVLQCHGSYS